MADLVPDSHPDCVAAAVYYLRDAQLVCYPTDTVYGLGAAAGNEAAVKRVFAVKGRPPNKPLPLLIADASAASWIADVTPIAHTLMTHFWPGGLTIVMKKLEDFRSLALAKQDTVALRVPDSKVTRDIIQTLGEPITGTSANRSGHRTPHTAAEVAFQMGPLVALVVDGGPVRQGIESTIVDVTGPKPRILREGAVSRKEIRRALPGKDVT